MPGRASTGAPGGRSPLGRTARQKVRVSTLTTHLRVRTLADRFSTPADGQGASLKPCKPKREGGGWR